jgi:hypothetical protein
MLKPNMWNSLGSSFGNFADLLMGEASRRRTAKENEEKLAKLEKAEADKEAESKRRWDEEHKLRTDKAAIENEDRKNQEAYQKALHERTKPGTAWTGEVPVAPPMENSDIFSKPYSSFLSGIPTSYTEEHSGAAAPMTQEERIALASKHGQVGSSAYNAVESGYAKATAAELAEEKARQAAEWREYLKQRYGEKDALDYDKFDEQKEQFKKTLAYKFAALQATKDRLELLKADNEYDYDYDELEKQVGDIKNYIATNKDFAQDPAFMEGNNKSLLSWSTETLKDKERLISRRKKPKAAAPPTKAPATTAPSGPRVINGFK